LALNISIAHAICLEGIKKKERKKERKKKKERDLPKIKGE
jgi:hypothetical protein